MDVENCKKNLDAVEVPPWLQIMYSTVFFSRCNFHSSAKRNELDRFCIDCVQPICSNCLHNHHDHHAHVKIRRYIYSEVIKKQDLSKIFNCHGIQTYYTNKAKVIFLKQRSQQQQQVQAYNSRDYNCVICYKSLQDNSLYCSIACKVSDIYRNYQNKEKSRKDETEKLKERKDCWAAISNKTRRKGKRKGFPFRAPMF